MSDWLSKLKDFDWQALAIAWGARIVGVLLIIFIGLYLVKWFSHMAERGMTRASIEPTAVQFLRKVMYAALLVLLFVIALQFVGVPMASLIAVLGAATLAIGFALKDSLSNIASGVMLITLRPFKAGDLVTINNQTGTVESVGIFLTLLRGADNQVVALPNSLVTGDSIINLTPDTMRRVELVIGIGKGDDIETARQEALRLMREDERVLADPEPSVKVYALADNSVTLGIRCHTLNADNFSTKCDLNERIKQAFDAAGVSIPSQQRDVHIFHHAPEGDVAPPRSLDGPRA